ncbi:MAG: imidazolonepropionase [Psychrilyobacter sp.]|nr:imidazolonepropionase [Psychrilyobacter sp.]
MKADLIIKNISNLVTIGEGKSPKRGQEMDNIEILENGYIIVKDGKFLEVGTGIIDLKHIGIKTIVKDGTGMTVTPGLIDPHTHLVHGGSRENEFAQKLQGVPYMDILNAGGGILSTVNSTKEATFEELYDKAKKSLDIMLSFGVTTVEAKSGYGLDLETEMKQLEVVKKLNEDHPIDLVSTYLGAHAVPPKYKSNPDKFVDEIIEGLPQIMESGLAEFCDVFCEEGVFSVEQTRKILNAAKELGFKIKIHADEIVTLGGAELAAELGAFSADHLMATSEHGIKQMAEKGVIADILPTTSFNLNKEYANARLMIEEGVAVALSTDYNPGSSPTENLQLAMQLGSLKLKMTPKEVISAVTINSAFSVDRGEEVGSITVGKKADFVVFDAPNLPYIMYHFGINHAKDVYKNGQQVVTEGKVLPMTKIPKIGSFIADCYGESKKIIQMNKINNK